MLQEVQVSVVQVTTMAVALTLLPVIVTGSEKGLFRAEQILRRHE